MHSDDKETPAGHRAIRLIELVTVETRDQATVKVEEHPPDAATILHRLRTAFPHWGFVHDPHTCTWTALRGPAKGGVTIVKRDPVALRTAVTEAQGRAR